MAEYISSGTAGGTAATCQGDLQGIRMKIVFLDIDGVMFSGRAAILPANAGLRKLPVRERMSRATFDAAAVELVNRLASRSGAQIVVHSDWRKAIGIDATRDKLVEQGLVSEYFHADWHTPVGRLAEKPAEIESWLETHMLTPAPVWPEPGDAGGPYPPPEDPVEQAALEAQIRAYHAARSNFGIDYIVIDDQEFTRFANRQIVIDQNEGFGIGDYKVALGMLGAADPGMGAYPVSPEDWEMVLAAHDAAKGWGPQIAAASAWLHLTAKRNDAWPRARCLDAAEVRRDAEFLAAFGYADFEADGGAARMREVALADLPKPAPKEIE